MQVSLTIELPKVTDARVLRLLADIMEGKLPQAEVIAQAEEAVTPTPAKAKKEKKAEPKKSKKVEVVVEEEEVSFDDEDTQEDETQEDEHEEVEEPTFEDEENEEESEEEEEVVAPKSKKEKKVESKKPALKYDDFLNAVREAHVRLTKAYKGNRDKANSKLNGLVKQLGGKSLRTVPESSWAKGIEACKTIKA